MKVKGKEKSIAAVKTTRNGINANLDSYQRSMRIKHLAFYRAMRIKFIRTILEMNIDDFAKFTSIHQGALGRMERAEACASLHAAEVIARACVTNQLLDVRAEWIINGTGTCPTFIKKKEIDITSYLRQLPEQQSAFNNTVDSSTKKYLTTFLFTKLFQSTYNNVISVLIKDDKMLPMFQKGDLVFGEIISR